MIIVPGILAAVVASVIVVFFFKRKITYWEAVLPLVVGVIVSLLCNFAVTISQTRDTEFHGGWFVEADYYEPWTEEYEVTVTDYCTRTDSKGSSETYACGSHQEKRTTYHPAQYSTKDSNGYEIRIDSDKFERECQKHGSRVFKDIYHSGQISFGDGNMYYTTWNGSEATFEPVTVAKTYENKVQASKSVFNFQEVDKEEIADFHLVEYPPIQDYYHMDSVIGPDIPGMHRANVKLNIANAKLGRSKQVRMFLIVWQDQPLEAAVLQESLWKGGNKNEFVVCVGIDKNHAVKWSYVFSWTEVDRVKFQVRDKAMALNPFDPVALVDYMIPEVQNQFIRKHFAEFSYLKVEPPFWGQVLSFFISIGTQIGLAVYLVKNQFDEDNDPLKSEVKMENNIRLRMIGDVHQMYHAYLPLLAEVPCTLQVGDLGLDYSYLRRIGLDAAKHKAMGGNHDNYEEGSAEYFKKQPNFLGDWGNYDVPGLPPIFYVRGAWSIDQEDRKRRQGWPNNVRGEVSWWPEEELSYAELERAIEAYKERKPQIVVTHECPMDIVQYVTNPRFCLAFGFPAGTIKTRTNTALQVMLDAHRPKLWVFGHYHSRWDETIDGTRFVCIDMLRRAEGTNSYLDIDDNFLQECGITA